jgi:hypothetical protein
MIVKMEKPFDALRGIGEYMFLIPKHPLPGFIHNKLPRIATDGADYRPQGDLEPRRCHEFHLDARAPSQEKT